MLVNQLACVRHYAPTGDVRLVRPQVLHEPPRDEDRQRHQRQARDKGHRVIWERRERKRVNERADEPWDEQLRADQPQHGQDGQAKGPHVFFGKFREKGKRFHEGCRFPFVFEIRTVALRPKPSRGKFQALRKLPSSIQKRPLPPFTHELIKPQGAMTPFSSRCSGSKAANNMVCPPGFRVAL